MPSGGRLVISAANTVVDEQYAGLNVGAKPGPHILLQVQDNGTGMAPHVLGKIFDPFFTTKAVGKGTGLGLSTTLGIVKSHAGSIRVRSEEGKGTLFQIYLPAQTGAAHGELAPAEAVMPRGHGELILVVDDESSVREITRHTLEAFGYRVVLASDGADALGKYIDQSKEIAVVLLDMTMPVMDGQTAIHVFQRINPNVQIIVTSGLASKGQPAKVAGLDVKHVLAKPYTAGELLSELHGILSA
jgi:CheY-like chemotaxis protein